jgi:hypothetical protein
MLKVIQMAIVPVGTPLGVAFCNCVTVCCRVVRAVVSESTSLCKVVILEELLFTPLSKVLWLSTWSVYNVERSLCTVVTSPSNARMRGVWSASIVAVCWSTITFTAFRRINQWCRGSIAVSKGLVRYWRGTGVRLETMSSMAFCYAVFSACISETSVANVLT